MNTATAKQKSRKRSTAKTVTVTAAVLLLAAIATHKTLAAALIAALIAALTVAVAVLAARARWRRYAAGGRIAARRRRKHQGWASGRDLLRARLTASALTRKICPGAGLLHLGTARRQPAAVCRENSALYTGPPGGGKTAALACHAADAPGLLFATSTKTDLLLDTLPYRDGPVWILNTDGLAGIPSTLAWSPVDGCEDPRTAKRRAGDFAQASPKSGKQDADYWAGMGAGLITIALHAAAVTGQTMREVIVWVRNPWAKTLRDAYAHPAADPMLATKLASLLGGEGEHMNGIIGAAEAALAWMDDWAMADAACPPPGQGFSPRQFARSHGSVYLIGEKSPYGSLAPYFAALGAEIFRQLKHHAAECGGRLPVPATFVLDEMPLTCPMPLHDMLAESRGPLITIIAAVQTLAQLRAKFGLEDGDTIRSACPVEVFFGGEKRIGDLSAVSDVLGKVDTWHGSTDELRDEPLLPPGALRLLGKGRAVILMPECRPILADLPAIWNRRGHQQASLDHPALQPRPSLHPPAVAPPRREAIPGHLRHPVTQAPPVPALTEGEVVPWHDTASSNA